jgi:nitrite reductase/ring-hydroxylating ferredoxin subunit
LLFYSSVIMMRHSSSSSSSSSLVFKQLLTSNPFRSSSSRRFLSVVGTQHHFNTLNSYLHHNNNNNKNNNNNNNANQGWRNYEKQALFLATGSAIGFLSARAFFHSDSVIHAAAPESTEETIEAVVGQTSDLKDGEMKPVAVGDQKFLLSRVKGQYYVTDLKCTHYGVPLHFGVISGDRIVCGAHGAAFSLKTGQVETSPGLDPLNTYPVRIEGPNIITTVPKIPRPVNLKKGKCCCKDSRVFVIIGGGPAGLMAAETARADGFKGKIILVTREQNLPYDRPSLSKGLGSPISKLLLRQEDFFSANSIDVQRGKKLVSVDRNSKSLTFDDGTKLNYNFVLFATGAE